MRDQDLIALTCKSGYCHTFCHGTHASRIDKIVRSTIPNTISQNARTDTQFERNFGQLGPHHHPVFVTLPKWYAKRSCPHPMHQIDREVVLNACLSQIPSWARFEADFCDLLTQRPLDTWIAPQDQMPELEKAIRQLYIQRFPKQSRCKSHSPLLQSISCRMWHARREALQLRVCSIADLFHCWKNLITYQALHRQIRKQSWLNKRWKLENILTEGADLAFRGQMYECYRKIRFCPKQPTI